MGLLKCTVPLLMLLITSSGVADRGEVAVYKDKFIWSRSGAAFVPNYVMVDMIANRREGGSSNDLSRITEREVDQFIQTFLVEHGFNGVHIPVYGQWFHVGDNEVKSTDREVDPATFAALAMIIDKVYRAGGCTHLWLWGDASRRQTSRSLEHGMMGREERQLLDEIHARLGEHRGWTMSYGFDLWEWVDSATLGTWYNYLGTKEGWTHLLGARASKNKLDQLYGGMDYASYEYHHPNYEELRRMIARTPDKPSFSEDRYRIRTPSKYPAKDYTEEATRRGLWSHTMAGGIAAIWGKLDGTGRYDNQIALHCFAKYWRIGKRFTKHMRADDSCLPTYCLTDRLTYNFYREDTREIVYRFSGAPKRVAAVDTKKKYREIRLGRKQAGAYIFRAPYVSDWAIAVE